MAMDVQGLLQVFYHGRVFTKESSKLPEKASGLLTIFQADEVDRTSPLQALESPQKHLHLDADRASEWMVIVREARR